MDTIDLYPFLEWIHILSATILLGAGVGSAYHMRATHKTNNPVAIAQAAKNTVNVDKYLTLPAAVIQPLTGVMMIVFVGFQWNSQWLLASYALYLLVGILWVPVLIKQKRAQILAEQAVKAGKKNLPEEYYRIMATWNRFGMTLVFVLVVILYIMVMKPKFWG